MSETASNKDYKGFRFLRALLTAIFLLAFSGACVYEYNALKQEEAELQATCDSIQEQITAEQAKVVLYKVDKAYYNSDEYRELMARNRFRMIFRGEVLIQVIEN
ncbi:MAG: septum formation initiator family protein [Lachnospiraceae bacterium]|nr:septum formation initiator family protein [Lachnospiraceae bacterium]